MRRFSNVQALALSFFSRDLYRDVASHWKGAGLLYQLLVIVLATLVIEIRMHLCDQPVPYLGDDRPKRPAGRP